MLRSNSEFRLNFQRPLHDRFGDWRSGHSLESRRQSLVTRGIASAKEQFEFDDSTGCDSAGEQQRFENGPHFGAGVSSGQRTLVGEKLSHEIVRSAPRRRHDLRFVEIESVAVEQQGHKLLALLNCDHFVERGIDRVGE
jgi:hypothetical protein